MSQPEGDCLHCEQPVWRTQGGLLTTEYGRDVCKIRPLHGGEYQRHEVLASGISTSTEADPSVTEVAICNDCGAIVRVHHDQLDVDGRELHKAWHAEWVHKHTWPWSR